MHCRQVGGSFPADPVVSRRFVIAAAAAAASTGCKAGSDLASGESGRIVTVSDGDVLTLEGGLRVRLSEIEAPWLGASAAPFAPEAREMLVAAALGQSGRLYYGGLSRDRYDRAIAHVIVQSRLGTDLWLNGYMARQGGGRVRSWPDNARRVRQLYALEDEARKQRRGLWGFDEYRVRSLDDLEGADGFTLVQGPLASIGEGLGQSSAILGREGIALAPASSIGKLSGIRLTPGEMVRVRGRLDRRQDPVRINLSHWGQIEALG